MSNRFHPNIALLAAIFLLLITLDARAEINSIDILDSVLNRYQMAASKWAVVITAHASRLFWTFTLISMVWTFGMMALRAADIGEFFAELTRFTIFTGFFWWLLINGPRFAETIMVSMRQIGGEATGLGASLTPSGIVDVGFEIFDRAYAQTSIWEPADSAIAIVISLVILVVLALVSVNMLLLLISGWVLAFAGVFFLGFGGSRWTSEIAINYYKTVLGLGCQLFVMVLIVGIGRTFLDDYFIRMNATVNFKELGVLLVVSIILLSLVNRLPSVVSGIITGAGLGSVSIGQLGGGAAFGAASMMSSAAAMSAHMATAGMAHAAGGASALAAAVAKGSDNVDSNSDLISSVFGNADTSKVAQDFYKNNPASKSPGGSSHSSSGQSMFGGSVGSGFMSAASRAGRIAADAGANLAKGAMDVGAGKVSNLKQSAAERIADTTGGRIASAINSSGADRPSTQSATTGQAFSGNGLSGGDGSVAHPARDPSRYIHGVDFSKMKFPGPGLPEGWGED